MRVLRIPVEGPCSLENVAITGEYLRECVGGSFEYLRLPQGGAYLACDEEGLLKRKPVNPRASGLWTLGAIVGDVVVVGPPDEDGNETAVPERVVIWAREFGWLS